ncbi:MAG: D-alanyl-D-alanine carboxypeptidase family protein [Oliverpabstia sp.]
MSKKQMTKKQLKRRKQRNRRILLFVLGFLLVGLLWFGVLIMADRWNNKTEKSSQDPAPQENVIQESAGGEDIDTQTPEPTPTEEPAVLPTVDLSMINSKSAILLKLTDMSVIAEKDADTRIYPASMTKIMTAVIGLENLSDLNQLIPVDRETYDRLYLEGASLAGFTPGEQVKAIDMLYGVMLPSGAECCVGLADFLFGSETAFVEKMNEKAQSLGMTNTHFVTSTGLHDPEHYTTVRDLSILLQYALGNETFRSIYCAHEYTTSPTTSNPSGLHFLSTMFKKMQTSEVNGGQIEGGKTGYTGEAGQCLASLAKIHDTEYILVTAGAPGSPSTEPYHILDAQNVYNQLGSTAS